MKPVHVKDVIEGMRKSDPTADGGAVLDALLNEANDNYILRRYIVEDWARTFTPIARKVLLGMPLTPKESEQWEKYAWAGPVA